MRKSRCYPRSSLLMSMQWAIMSLLSISSNAVKSKQSEIQMILFPETICTDTTPIDIYTFLHLSRSLPLCCILLLASPLLSRTSSDEFCLWRISRPHWLLAGSPASHKDSLFALSSSKFCPAINLSHAGAGPAGSRTQCWWRRRRRLEAGGSPSGRAAPSPTARPTWPPTARSEGFPRSPPQMTRWGSCPAPSGQPSSPSLSRCSVSSRLSWQLQSASWWCVVVARVSDRLSGPRHVAFYTPALEEEEEGLGE